MTRPGHRMLRSLKWNLLHPELLWRTATTKYQIWEQKRDKKKIIQPITLFKDLLSYLFTFICACAHGQVGAYRDRRRHRVLWILWAEARGAWNCPTWVLGAQSWPPGRTNLLATELILQQPPITFLPPPKKSLGDHFSTCLAFIHPYKSIILYKNIPRKLSSRET